MGDISRHFSRTEFACKCGCGFNAVDKELVEVLEETIAYYEKHKGVDYLRAFITGPNRCEAHNRAVKGANNSQHTKGMAADFKIEGIDSDLLYIYLDKKYADKYGIGRYTGRVHIDMRSKKVRWDHRG